MTRTAVVAARDQSVRSVGAVEPAFFEIVRDAFEGFVVGVGGRRNLYVHSRGLKVWFDDDTREHYESPLIRVDGVVQIEIGFHAGIPKAPQNDEVLRRLLAVEPVWRPDLGDDAVAGEFVKGRAGWRRISEVWPAPDSEVVDEAIETAARLADYVQARWSLLDARARMNDRHRPLNAAAVPATTGVREAS